VDKNQAAYGISKVVEDYRARDALYPAEAAILALLPDPSGLSVLDVGIGGGRTTLHLMDKVREYIGIDYAEPMVAACRARFPAAPETRFQVGDVRKLAFPDARFDFILFSYNGLDYIGHEDRLMGLRELHRVGRHGSLMALSSHNLSSLGRVPAARPKGLPARLRALALKAAVRLINGDPAKLRAREHALVRDEGCGFKLRTYYVHPAAMIKSLEAAGFRDTRIFSISGEELGLDGALASSEPYLHYLSRRA